MSKGEQALVSCTTTKGPVLMEFHRDWAPNGYDRAVTLFERGFYDESHFYRVVPNLLVQFGLTYKEDLKNLPPIPDDPKPHPPLLFDKGTISFAGSGPNTRSATLFIAYTRAENLGAADWETPVGRVVQGMEHVESFYSYGDIPPMGNGPDPKHIFAEGRNYIEHNFPLTDHFETCQVKRFSVQEQIYLSKVHQKEQLKAEIKQEIYHELAAAGMLKPPTPVGATLLQGRLPLVLASGAVLVLILILVKVSPVGKKKSRSD